MLFNSLEYWLFLPTVFLLYWQMGRRGQNVLLLIASYVFYGWWDYRFLSLIAISSAVDFVVGRRMAEARPHARRAWLGLSLATNLGILGFFKYYNFFASSFADLLQSIGLSADPTTLNIVLPVGISFYTFQTLSYTIDIYRGELEPRRSVLEFFTFVAFFPQLVAGPIERARNLLPQFERPRVFDEALARDGLRQILWGLTKKVLIADNIAKFVNAGYAAPENASGATLLLGTVFFAFQIYCDFSGYSDIAIGSAKLLGFRLMRNFAYPYFASDIAEFWRRWHISLSTWFRDYVYISLGGNRVASPLYVRNILATFVLSGLWHGASWTFVAWGTLHAVFFLVHSFYRSAIGLRHRESSGEPGWVKTLLACILTFVAVSASWVLFRAESLGDAVVIFGRMATDTDPLQLVKLWPMGKIFIVGLLVAEWLQRNNEHALAIERLPGWLRWATYYALIATIFFKGSFDYEPFIYFQF